ncbi:MAG: succinylglutamate desuccinylase/aspartoacylase family protein [Methylocystaceae bacterium]|nr:succinylglutamate desuccinylase/aspartoacylase family protein [Methylocystaceae bacterium]
MRAPFEIGGVTIPAGQRKTVDISVGTFSNHMPASIPVRVIHGRRPGPTLFISSVVHGDEIIGVEIVRRLLNSRLLNYMKGTLLCIPVVNTYGFISHSRYLPDRRDLNRSFPGAQDGSLAGQLAHVFMREIVKRSNYGIDLHSAATHRVNLPQVRFQDNSPELLELARAFGAPVALEAPLRENSLREAAGEVGVQVLLYESGEALRFDEYAVRIGLRGILNVMHHIGMISKRKASIGAAKSVLAHKSKWCRSPVGGIFRAMKTIGDVVNTGDCLGYISDPFGEMDEPVTANLEGVIIGRTNLPIVNPGDALYHIAAIKKIQQAEEKLTQMEVDIEADPLFDEDEII